MEGRSRSRSERHCLPKKQLNGAEQIKARAAVFLDFIYSRLRRANNEGCCLLMLTAGDNFGLGLLPKNAWRTGGRRI